MFFIKEGISDHEECKEGSSWINEYVHRIK